MAIYLDNEGIKRNVILVYYSFSDLPFNANKLQYLRALSIAIYVSAFITKDENIGNDLDMVVHGIVSRETNLGCGNESADSSVSPSTGSNTTLVETATLADCGDSITDTQNRNLTQPTAPSSPSSPLSPSSLSYPNVLSERVTEFLYPTSQLPVLKSVSNNLSVGDFGSSLEFLANGSNCNVYRAKYNNSTVVVKMLKEERLTSPMALQELRTEQNMLVRLAHENIINIVGTGDSSNGFIALEYLGGGTLHKLLHGDPKSSSSSSSHVLNLTGLFKKKPVFSLTQSLLMARDIASVLDYLHDRCCADACIIHRGERQDPAYTMHLHTYIDTYIHTYIHTYVLT